MSNCEGSDVSELLRNVATLCSSVQQLRVLVILSGPKTVKSWLTKVSFVHLFCSYFWSIESGSLKFTGSGIFVKSFPMKLFMIDQRLSPISGLSGMRVRLLVTLPFIWSDCCWCWTFELRFLSIVSLGFLISKLLQWPLCFYEHWIWRHLQ